MKKSKFQNEIEEGQKRLEQIYNRILSLYHPEKHLDSPTGDNQNQNRCS